MSFFFSASVTKLQIARREQGHSRRLRNARVAHGRAKVRRLVRLL